MKIYVRPRHFILLSFSSLFFALSFDPWNFWPLGFLSLIFIFFLLEEKIPNKRTALMWGFILGLMTDIFAYHWIIYTMKIFGHLPLVIAIILFILYSFFSNLRFGLFFILIYYWQKYHQSKTKENFHFSSLFFFPIFWYLTERFIWRLFPWHGGNLVSGNLLFLQSADILGIYGMSLIWFSLNQFFYLVVIYLYQNFYQKKFNFHFLSRIERIRRIHLIPGIILFIAIHIYGFLSLHFWDEKYSNAEQKIVGITQGNTPLSFAEIRDMRTFLFNITRNMVDQSIELYQNAIKKYGKLDLLLWPESSVPFLRYNRSSFLQEEIKRMYDHIDSEFIFNDILEKYEMKEKKYVMKSYSNLWYFNSKGKPVANYQKNYPLPFGETIPLGNTFPIVYKIMPEVSDFSASDRVNLFHGKSGIMLPSICYETILPDFMLHFYRKTNSLAQMIINVTNDTWFGKSIETWEHMSLAKIRSVEYRIPQLRAVNSGVSVHIDHAGRVHNPTPIFERVNRIYPVKIIPNASTIFSKVRNIPLDVISVLSILFLFFHNFLIRRINPQQ